MIQYSWDVLLPTTSAFLPTVSAPRDSYPCPGPERQCVSTLTLIIGTEGVDVKAIVGGGLVGFWGGGAVDGAPPSGA